MLRSTLVSGALVAAILLGTGVSLAAQTYRFGASPVPAPVAASLPYGHTSPVPVDESAKAVDLSNWFPRPGSQGMQNSCVAWASTYAIKSFQEQAEIGGAFMSGSLLFSPSFVYNQINGGRDEGSSLVDAATLLKNIGAVTMDVMPVSTDYRKKPSQDQIAKAAPFKISSFSMIKPNDIAAMKSYLRQGHPILIGAEVYENFEDYRGGVYAKTTGKLLGGHAMTILGFDDSKKAFRLINSWGTNWGDNGYAWIDYDLFGRINKDALVMIDNTKASPSSPGVPLSVQAGKGTRKDRVEVTWAPVNGIEYYEVFRSAQPKEGYASLAKVKGTVYFDTDVAEGELYYYAVKSGVGKTLSAFSEAAQGFVQASPGLGVVQGLQSKVEKGEIRLFWSPVDGAKGYHIYRYLADKDAFARVGTSSDTGFADASLKDAPGTYYYLVTAYTDSKESPNSNSVAVQIPSVPVPLPLVSPQGLVATRGTRADRVDLSWKAVPGAQQYVVLRYDFGKESWQIMAGTKANSWSDMKASKNETYYTVVSRQGDNLSEIGDFVIGFTGKLKTPPPSPGYADAAYYEEQKKQKAGNNEGLFKNDSFFTKPSVLFDTIRPQDFFFVDEAKFFALNPDFFKVAPDFFVDTSSIFN